MFTFFLSLVKLLSAAWRGIRQDQQFRVLIYTLFILLAGATTFYSQIEGWTAVDSLYFAVMTMTTIGYGDLTPTSISTKLFTIVYTVLSIGIFVAFVTKLVKTILDKKLDQVEKIKKFVSTHRRKSKSADEPDRR